MNFAPFDKSVTCFQTQRWQFLPLCQTSLPSRQKCLPTVSQWQFPTTAPKQRGMWECSSGSSPTPRLTTATRPAHPLTPPSPKASRTLPRRYVSLSHHRTIELFTWSMQPAVGLAFPSFIWTHQNSGQCVIMPLSHPHNKVLYLLSQEPKPRLSFFLFNLEGNYPWKRETQQKVYYREVQ